MKHRNGVFAPRVSADDEAINLFDHDFPPVRVATLPYGVCAVTPNTS